MTVNAWTVIGTGIALAALNIGLFRWLHGDMAGMKEDIKKLGARLSAVEKEQARTCGLLEGLGFTGRATPTAQPGAH